MMVLMMVSVFFIRDQREDRFHQVKIVNPSHHHQHLVDVVWDFLLVCVW